MEFPGTRFNPDISSIVAVQAIGGMGSQSTASTTGTSSGVGNQAPDVDNPTGQPASQQPSLTSKAETIRKKPKNWFIRVKHKVLNKITGIAQACIPKENRLKLSRSKRKALRLLKDNDIPYLLVDKKRHFIPKLYFDVKSDDKESTPEHQFQDIGIDLSSDSSKLISGTPAEILSTSNDMSIISLNTSRSESSETSDVSDSMDTSKVSNYDSEQSFSAKGDTVEVNPRPTCCQIQTTVYPIAEALVIKTGCEEIKSILWVDSNRFFEDFPNVCSINQPNNQLASLYVGDLAPEVTEDILFDKFSPFGSILSIRVCRNRYTGISLGYGYINFKEHSDAQMALDWINFEKINGRPLRIMWSQRDPSLRKSGVGNIFIKNLDKSIDSRVLLDTVCCFGNILSCKVAQDKKGNSKGYGYVHFDSEEAATKFIYKMNGMLLNGKKVFVGKFVPRNGRVASVGHKPNKFTNVYVKNLDDQIDPIPVEVQIQSKIPVHQQITDHIMVDQQLIVTPHEMVRPNQNLNRALPQTTRPLGSIATGLKRSHFSPPFSGFQKDYDFRRSQDINRPSSLNRSLPQSTRPLGSIVTGWPKSLFNAPFSGFQKDSDSSDTTADHIHSKDTASEVFRIDLIDRQNNIAINRTNNRIRRANKSDNKESSPEHQSQDIEMDLSSDSSKIIGGTPSELSSKESNEETVSVNPTEDIVSEQITTDQISDTSLVSTSCEIGNQMSVTLKERKQMSGHQTNDRPISYSKIEDNLYLGNFQTAINERALICLNIRKVLTLRRIAVPEECKLQGIEYLHIPINDTLNDDILTHFADCHEFIKEGQCNGKAVYVHCWVGVSRSATIVISYLMAKYGLSWDKALRKVREIRNIVNPNPAFIYQLQLFGSMDCKLNPMNTELRYHLLERWIHVIKKNLIEKSLEVDQTILYKYFPLTTLNPDCGGQTYHCWRCKTKLFRDLHVIRDLSSEGCDNQCNHSLIIEPQQWFIGDVCNKPEGVIQCPKCKTDLEYNSPKVGSSLRVIADIKFNQKEPLVYRKRYIGLNDKSIETKEFFIEDLIRDSVRRNCKQIIDSNE